MNFETFVNQAWSDHAENTVLVAERLPAALNLIESPEQVSPLVALITHVYGEHLGQWEDGIKLIEEVGSYTDLDPEAKSAVRRAVAVLKVAADQLDSVEEFSLSDQIRIFATATSALAGQGYFDRASRFFKISLTKIQAKLKPDDPAYRAMAITSNNLACSLEEKRERSADEIELMLTAARASRVYWEKVGTWVEVERAEYRMAMAFLASGDADAALQHATLCKEICESHRAAPEELFWAFEAIARIEWARKNSAGYEEAMSQASRLVEKVDHSDRSWNESLDKLKSLAKGIA